jgi:transglutaminase-like putative cysteine protease/drug/metabolite transporter superfamily protein YnfA
MKAADRKPQFDWIPFFLILTLNLIAAWALNATDWADHLAVIPLISFFAVLAGSALAVSVFPGWLASIFASSYGLFLISRQLAETSQSVFIWKDRIISLLGRVGVLMRVILRGETNQDPLMFVFLMALLFWFLGSFSAWSVFRRRDAWGAILPGGLTLTIFNLYYYGRSRLGIYLGLYILLSLFLTIWVDLSRRQSGWQRDRARVPTDTLFRTVIVGFGAAILLVGLAWVTPAFARSDLAAEAWNRITSPFESIKERVGDTLGSVRGPVPVMPSEYSDVLALEGGEQPVNRFVMEVNPFQQPTHGGRFYWRSRVYQVYDGVQWTVPEATLEPFNPESQPDLLQDFEGRQQVEVSIAPKSAAIRQLYAPSQPVWSDRNMEIAVTEVDEQVVDVLAFRVQDYLYEGETYRVRSSVATPSEYQLRQSGQEYPEWVLERYLQVPEAITDRTLDLAEQITAEFDTPYDKALAVTGWLRQNIEYSRETDAPPTDVEPIDWFLFDYQIGFCNYYASAEVIMLRSLGIPARLAAGYARGTYNPSEGLYQVYGEDSHAWPEVYFPGIGWVEFEPTVSQPVLVRPEGGPEEDRFGGVASPSGPGAGLDPDEQVQDVEDIELPPETGFNFSLQNPVIRRSITIALITLFLIAAWIRLNPVTWQRTRSFWVRGARGVGVLNSTSEGPISRRWETNIGKVYRNFTAWLERLELIKGTTQTANERALVFARTLPESSRDAWTIVEAYERERFGGVSVEASEVFQAWRRLRWQLWMAWLWKLTARWRRTE